MSACFGLHIGNTCACLAVQRDGRTDVVANAAGHRVTPVSVGFNGSEVLTGLSAKQFGGRFPRCVVVRGNKRLMGLERSEEDGGQLEAYIGASGRDSARLLAGAGNAPPWYEIEGCEEAQKGRRVELREIYGHILKNMHEIALSHAVSDSAEDMNTVLTVPLDWTAQQRAQVAAVADKVGFNVVQVVSEPGAACMAYGLGQLDPTECFRALVVRIGGLTTDVSVVLVHAGFVSVLASVRKNVGGQNITKILADYLAAEFQRKYKVDPRETKRGKVKLMNNAENVKHILSSLDTANCYIESLYDGIDFNANVTRARFENELGKILTDFLSPIHDALDKADCKPSQIEKVVLCGGTGKIPKIQKSVTSIVESAQVLSSISPDEVLACGAAEQAGLVSEKQEFPDPRPEIQVLNSSVSFTVGGADCELIPLIPRLVPIPVRKSHHLASGEGKSVAVYLVDEKGERNSMGTLNFPDELGETSKLSLSAHVHRDGSIHVALTDKASGKCDQFTVNAS